MSPREKSREKRQNAGKTSGEISNWKCSLMALMGSVVNRLCELAFLTEIVYFTIVINLSGLNVCLPKRRNQKLLIFTGKL